MPKLPSPILRMLVGMGLGIRVPISIGYFERCLRGQLQDVVGVGERGGGRRLGAAAEPAHEAAGWAAGGVFGQSVCAVRNLRRGDEDMRKNLHLVLFYVL